MNDTEMEGFPTQRLGSIACRPNVDTIKVQLVLQALTTSLVALAFICVAILTISR